MTAKERPILFSAPMVQAILDGRKTMSRRVVNKLTSFGQITEFSESDTSGYDFCFRDKQMRLHDLTRARVLECCPYGKPGERLWVREPFNVVYYGGHYNSIGNVKSSNETFAIICKATPGHYTEIDVTDKNHPYYEQLYRLSDSGPDGNKFRPSIHMPRWASRILLEVTEVRIERLQDISQGDALSEGVLTYTDWMTPEYKAQCEAARINGTEPPLGYSPRQRFQHLWDSINGPGAWDANPFVWVISFRRIEP